MIHTLCNKIVQRFEQELEIYVRAYIEVSGHFENCSNADKEAVVWECTDMITDYSETKDNFETWASMMYFDMEKCGEYISAIDDDSLDPSTYKKYMDFEFIDEIILDLLDHH